MALNRRHRLLLCAALCATAHGLRAAAYEEDVGEGFEGEYEDPILDEEAPYEEHAFSAFAQKVQRSVDGQGLLRARRWGNIANGLLLGATGPVTLVVSAVGLKLSGVVMSAYLSAVGALLAGIELGVAPVAPWAADNLSWLTTQPGKTALLFFAGNLAWAFGKAGLVPGLLTCVNAAFNWKFRHLFEFVTADEEPSGVGGAPFAEGTMDAQDLAAAFQAQYAAAEAAAVAEAAEAAGYGGGEAAARAGQPGADYADEEAQLEDEGADEQASGRGPE